MNTFKSSSYSFIAAAICAMWFTGCSDDLIVSNPGTKGLIQFDVDYSSDFSDISNTRGGAARPSLDILKLDGTESDLYLVPQIEPTAPLIHSMHSESGTTRAQLVDSSNMESFGVYAGYTSESGTDEYIPDYMSNVEISRSADWMPHEEYLWPGDGSLHFNAYSPYYSSESNDGIQSVQTVKGEIILTYNSPSAVSSQADLLYASPTDASSSPCRLSFNHALTAVKFVTGAEMAPCTIKKITISNVLSSGQLDLESGNWSNLSSPSDFSVSPDLSLEAAEGSEYVESGAEITSSDETFLFIPQSLPDNAEITVSIEIGGNEYTLSSSLKSQIFPEGKTITYRISANPEADSLILDITGDFNTDYTGSSKSFNVKSLLNKDGSSTPIAWIAEFIDNKGNVIPKPDWISNFTMNGEGNSTGQFVTVMNNLVFENMSAPTRTLQAAADINISSGCNPYNLSSSSGSAAVENTANTYVINAPGIYSFPLVYGNAIKNGADNTQAYVPGTHNSKALKNFTNHLNNAITSPYIYDNTGCTPVDAVLIWEDELNLIRDVALSDDGKTISFRVPHNTIREGNALVAVRDANKSVMWSWQIWVTDYTPSTGVNTITVSGKSYSLASENLGYVVGGDRFSFPECSVKVRFTQSGLPEGVEALSKTVTITQSGIEQSTPAYNTYYQWGRKDPMMSGDKEFFDASHKKIESHPIAAAYDLASTNNLMQEYILHPDTFYLGEHDNDESSASYTPYPYNNFWNGAYSSTNIKTVYDPSPIGFVVPYSEPLIDFVSQASSKYTLRYTSSDTASEQQGFYLTVLSTGEVIYFPDFGYISGATGATASYGALASYWTSHAIQTLKTGGVVQFLDRDNLIKSQQTTNPLFHGMGVRAIKE